jgi:hypothetical protein
MTVTIVDQIMAFLTTDANRATFNTAIGLAAYAGKSFLRRYGVGGFQLDSVTLGTPADFRLQQIVATNPRLMGYSERRSEKPERKWIDYTLHRPELAGWVDATFAAQVTMALHAVPGSIVLGPGADVRDGGTATAPPPMSFRTSFLLGLDTDAFTLNYTMQVYVLLAADLAPAADLRRIQQIRSVLEADPGFLVSLDGPTDQRPFVFAQIYAQNSAAGGPLTPAAITVMFDQADVLAAFFTPPA